MYPFCEEAGFRLKSPKLLQKCQLNSCLDWLNNDYFKKITIFKMEAGMLTLISHHYNREEERKPRGSSAEEKKRLEPGTRSKIKAELSVSSSPVRLTSLTK